MTPLVCAGCQLRLGPDDGGACDVSYVQQGADVVCADCLEERQAMLERISGASRSHSPHSEASSNYSVTRNRLLYRGPTHAYPYSAQGMEFDRQLAMQDLQTARAPVEGRFRQRDSALTKKLLNLQKGGRKGIITTDGQAGNPIPQRWRENTLSRSPPRRRDSERDREAPRYSPRDGLYAFTESGAHEDTLAVPCSKGGARKRSTLSNHTRRTSSGQSSRMRKTLRFSVEPGTASPQSDAPRVHVHVPPPSQQSANSTYYARWCERRQRLEDLFGVYQRTGGRGGSKSASPLARSPPAPRSPVSPNNPGMESVRSPTRQPSYGLHGDHPGTLWTHGLRQKPPARPYSFTQATFIDRKGASPPEAPLPRSPLSIKRADSVGSSRGAATALANAVPRSVNVDTSPEGQERVARLLHVPHTQRSLRLVEKAVPLVAPSSAPRGRDSELGISHLSRVAESAEGVECGGSRGERSAFLSTASAKGFFLQSGGSMERPPQPGAASPEQYEYSYNRSVGKLMITTRRRVDAPGKALMRDSSEEPPAAAPPPLQPPPLQPPPALKTRRPRDRDDPALRRATLPVAWPGEIDARPAAGERGATRSPSPPPHPSPGGPSPVTDAASEGAEALWNPPPTARTVPMLDVPSSVLADDVRDGGRRGSGPTPRPKESPRGGNADAACTQARRGGGGAMEGKAGGAAATSWAAFLEHSPPESPSHARRERWGLPLHDGDDSKASSRSASPSHSILSGRLQTRPEGVAHAPKYTRLDLGGRKERGKRRESPPRGAAVWRDVDVTAASSSVAETSSQVNSPGRRVAEPAAPHTPAALWRGEGGERSPQTVRHRPHGQAESAQNSDTMFEAPSRSAETSPFIASSVAHSETASNVRVTVKTNLVTDAGAGGREQVMPVRSEYVGTRANTDGSVTLCVGLPLPSEGMQTGGFTDASGSMEVITGKTTTHTTTQSSSVDRGAGTASVDVFATTFGDVLPVSDGAGRPGGGGDDSNAGHDTLDHIGAAPLQTRSSGLGTSRSSRSRVSFIDGDVDRSTAAASASHDDLLEFSFGDFGDAGLAPEEGFGRRGSAAGPASPRRMSMATLDAAESGVDCSWLSGLVEEAAEFTCTSVAREAWGGLPVSAVLAELRGAKVIGIARVVNAAKQQAWEAMKAASGPGDEHLVFHGTHERLLPSILAKGFAPTTHPENCDGVAAAFTQDPRSVYMASDLSLALPFCNPESQSLANWWYGRAATTTAREYLVTPLPVPTQVKVACATLFTPHCLDADSAPGSEADEPWLRRACDWMVRDASLLSPAQYILHLQLDDGTPARGAVRSVSMTPPRRRSLSPSAHTEESL